MASFTTRKGKIVEVKDYTIDAATMVSIHRLKEDFALRGEYLSLYGVVQHVVSQGMKSTRHYWKAAEKLRNKNIFANKAAKLFDANGKVRDPQALAALAMKCGLIKGTPVELSNPEPEDEEPEDEEELELDETESTESDEEKSTESDEEISEETPSEV